MQNLAALRQQAIDYHQNSFFVQAAEAAHKYLEHCPTDRPMIWLLAESCLLTGYIDEAERLLEFDLKLGPMGNTVAGLAQAKTSRGETEQAYRLLREALKIEPCCARAWAELGVSHKFKPKDPLITKAKRLLREGKPNDREERAICYALCKAMNDLGNWDQAWDYATRAAQACEVNHNPDAMRRLITSQLDTFDAEFLTPREGRGLHESGPIFVVGMPRSGTTLVEAVICATGQVTAMGELVALPEICRDAAKADSLGRKLKNVYIWTRRMRDEAFTTAARTYLGEVKRRNNGVMPTRFVDKLPGNAFHLGELALYFPNAPIIWVERDPLDTCTSCYLGGFGMGHTYVTRPDWLGNAALCYRETCEKMWPMLPNPRLRIKYEEFVSNPEVETKRLTDFLGLPWDEVCLAPGSAGHTAITRSKAQIRQRINNRSVGRWKRYRNRIGPLAEALGVDLEEQLAA